MSEKKHKKLLFRITDRSTTYTSWGCCERTDQACGQEVLDDGTRVGQVFESRVSRNGQTTYDERHDEIIRKFVAPIWRGLTHYEPGQQNEALSPHSEPQPHVRMRIGRLVRVPSCEWRIVEIPEPGTTVYEILIEQYHARPVLGYEPPFQPGPYTALQG